MDKQAVAEVLAKPISQQLLLEPSPMPARFAYVGLDGDPRVIPVGYFFDGTRIIIGTAANSAKVPALRKNPRVAITFDPDTFPRRALLVRGTASVELVQGVPEEYIESGRKSVPTDEFEAWEAGVRGLYDEMVLIRVEPTWAKLLDFETTIPKAVEELVKAKMAEQG